MWQTKLKILKTNFKLCYKRLKRWQDKSLSLDVNTIKNHPWQKISDL